MSGSVSFDNLSSLMRTSESFSDLNAELNPLRGRGASSNMASSRGASGLSNEEGSVTNNKPFGLGEYFSALKYVLPVEVLQNYYSNFLGLVNSTQIVMGICTQK